MRFARVTRALRAQSSRTGTDTGTGRRVGRRRRRGGRPRRRHSTNT